MVFAAPVVGLAYVLLFPFIGLATLLWLAGRGGRGADQRLSVEMAN